MDNFKKVAVWRIISVVITLVITGAWTGSIAKASGLTIVLQLALFLAHWAFERWWLNMTVNKILAPKKTPREKTASGLEGWDHRDWRPTNRP